MADELRQLRWLAHREAELIWGDWRTTANKGQMYRFIQEHFRKGHIADLNEMELRKLLKLLRKQQHKRNIKYKTIF